MRFCVLTVLSDRPLNRLTEKPASPPANQPAGQPAG